MQLAEVRNNLFHGTITAGGTLTNEIDLGGFSLFGLISDNNLVNGTLSFQVSAYSDNDSSNTSDYVDLTNGDVTALSFGATGSQIAVSADEVVQALAAYRYVKIKMSNAQTNGCKFYLPAKV